jgi:5-(carboxyamino)imidazole ribonucleotide synthase
MIGILGGGQLGRMLALAGYPLGLRFRFLDPSPAAPVAPLAEHIRGEYEDHQTLQQFATGLQLITYEFENVPVASAQFLTQYAPVYPPPQALQTAQDRLIEKTFLQQLAIPTPAFAAVNSCQELHAALARIGTPAVLKTRRFGYDGKGQYVLRTPEQASPAWDTLGSQGDLILEQFIPFEREVSMLAIRSRAGDMAFYPLVENHHRAGMLRRSLAPAPALTPALQQTAEQYASRVLQALQYVGVLAIEFFHLHDQLLANEMAPRVHNSGHWTIEGAETSQFENHLRAVLGLPLGATNVYDNVAMLNIVGALPALPAVLAVPGAHLHLYGKLPRPGRKLGHITLRAANQSLLQARLKQLCQYLNELG